MSSNAERELRYRDQLAFLNDGGSRMAALYPRVAGQLAAAGNDPDVERLLEGIAFRTGQVEGRQARELPLYWQLVLDLCFPHYLSPQPAAAIVAIDSDSSQHVPAGSEIWSLPVQGTRCRFRTAYPVTTGGYEVASATWQERQHGAKLTLRLTTKKPEEPVSDDLLIYLRGEPAHAAALYQWLIHHLAAVQLSADANDAPHLAKEISVEPVGFDPEEALLPYPPGSPHGLRLLHEYFLLPQKFFFVRVKGLGIATRRLGISGDTLTVSFALRGEAQQPTAVKATDFHLGCTPVINVFEHTADPVRRDPIKTQIPLRPAGRAEHYEVFRVLNVASLTHDGMRHYPVLSDLEVGNDASRCFAQLHRRRSGEQVHWSASLWDAPPLRHGQTETVMADLLCTNGLLPIGLRVGDICDLSGKNETVSKNKPSATLRCRNITAVTDPLPVPTDQWLKKAVVIHLALAQRSGIDRDALREALDLYHLGCERSTHAAQEHRLLRSAVRDVVRERRIASYQGDAISGLRTTLAIDETAFPSEGELYLFGCVINEMVALHAPINHFSEFHLQPLKKRDAYRWARRCVTGH